MKILLLLFLNILWLTCYSQEKKDTILVGVYVKALYDLSPSDYSFGADFYIWNNTKDSVPLFKTLEIINAKKIDDYSSFNEKDGSSFVSFENCKAQLTYNWNLKNYPFDKQKLKIILESQNNVDLMYLTEDQNSFQIAHNLQLPGWNIEKYYTENGLATYSSDFGYHYGPKKGKKYNQLSFVIELSRISWGVFFKLFTGLFIAFLVSYLALFIKPEFVDPRFGLSIGGLFASVANKYVVDSNIPATISFSYIDMVHFISFVFIFATLVISTLSLKLYTQGKNEKRKLLDKRAAIIIMLLYILLNIMLIIFTA